MSDQSLGRVVKLRVFATIIGQEQGLAFVDYNSGYTEFSSVQPDGSPGFRIRGRCIQTQPAVGFNTNQIEVEIFNLGFDSRSLVQSKVGTKIQVFAGYGDNAKQICQGNIIWAKTHKDRPLFITEIVAGDSHFGLVSGEIHRSFKGSVTYQQVVDACVSALSQSQLFEGTIDVPEGSYNNGIVLNGSPLDELKKVCDKIGRTLSIVGGAINILPIGQDNGAPVIEVSEDTGMVGVPEIHPLGSMGVVPSGAPVTPDLDMSFSHLLRPELVLSQRIRMVSKFVKGEYVILRNVFDFDSWNGPFYNRCQCQKVVVGGA